MNIFITFIDTLISWALADATALIASDLWQLVMFFLGLYFIYKFIRVIKGA